MIKINDKNMIEELENLKIGEKIFLPMNEDINNTIKFLFIKCGSYENLFNSYINSTCEEANKMNLDAFLERYTEVYSDIEVYKQAILRECLGQAYEYFIRTKFNYNFNFDLQTLEITKIGGTK